jgi:hypothetical protein
MVGGKVALSDDCCCGGNCPTAVQIQVDFSGVLNCGCISQSPSSSRVSEDPLPIIGTPIVLDQTFSDTWDNSLQPPTDVTLLEYLAVTDCSIIPTSTTVFALAITLTCDDSGWDLQVNFRGRTSWLFRSSGSPPLHLGSALPNEFLIGMCGPDGFGNVNYGHSGTATITEI